MIFIEAFLFPRIFGLDNDHFGHEVYIRFSFVSDNKKHSSDSQKSYIF